MRYNLFEKQRESDTHDRVKKKGGGGLKKCETYCEEKPTLKMWIYKVEYETPITGR